MSASLFYRLSGDSPFPADIEDCKCDVRFLRTLFVVRLVETGKAVKEVTGWTPSDPRDGLGKPRPESKCPGSIQPRGVRLSLPLRPLVTLSFDPPRPRTTDRRPRKVAPGFR